MTAHVPTIVSNANIHCGSFVEQEARNYRLLCLFFFYFGIINKGQLMLSIKVCTTYHYGDIASNSWRPLIREFLNNGLPSASRVHQSFFPA